MYIYIYIYQVLDVYFQCSMKTQTVEAKGKKSFF